MAKSSIEKYLDADLFKELGMENMPPEERALFLEKFGSVIEQKILLRLTKELSSEAKDRIAKEMEAPENEGKFLELAAKEMPGILDVMNEEIASYKKELIESMKK